MQLRVPLDILKFWTRSVSVKLWIQLENVIECNSQVLTLFLRCGPAHLQSPFLHHRACLILFQLAFLHWSSSVYLYLSCKLFSHCLVDWRLFISPPLCLLQGCECAQEGSCLQHEQETSDFSSALIGCFDLGVVDSSKRLQGQQAEPQEHDFFHRLSHVLLSGQTDSFSKYDKYIFIKVNNFCFNVYLCMTACCM